MLYEKRSILKPDSFLDRCYFQMVLTMLLNLYYAEQVDDKEYKYYAQPERIHHKIINIINGFRKTIFTYRIKNDYSNEKYKTIFKKVFIYNTTILNKFWEVHSFMIP